MSEHFALTPDHLLSRHQYWKERIHDKGIWDKNRFKEVILRVGPRSRRYNGMFRRVRKGGFLRNRWEDSIIIYDNAAHHDPSIVDNTLVHEMIHQYIAHAALKDKSTHGPLFRDFMKRINETFRGELSITITTKIVPETGPGKKLHPLLLLEMRAGYFLCCKLSNANAPRLIKEIKSGRYRESIKEAHLYCSADLYFDSLTACRTRLQGAKILPPDLPSFIEKYQMVLVK